MRLIVLILTTTFGTAFAQDNPGQTASATPPNQIRIGALTFAPKTCSIPLLNATAPGKPVPMPKVQPRESTQKFDRMEVVDPAPACPAKFASNVGPADSTRPGQQLTLPYLPRLTPQQPKPLFFPQFTPQPAPEPASPAPEPAAPAKQ